MHGPVDSGVTAAEAADKRLLGNCGKLAGGICQVIGEAGLVIPLFGLAFFLILELDPQPRAQHGLGAQHMAQAGEGEHHGIKIFRVRRKRHRGAGIAFSAGVYHFQFGLLLAAGERHAVDIAVATDLYRKRAGQRIDHRHPHTEPSLFRLTLISLA